MAKINWLQARVDYVSDESLSYEDIAKKYGTTKRAIEMHASKDKWVQLRADTSATLRQKLPEKISESIADVKVRHIQTAKILQSKGLRVIVGDPKNGIAGMEPETFDNARRSVKDGVEIERKALGMDEPTIPAVNVNVGIFNNPTVRKDYQE